MVKELIFLIGAIGFVVVLFLGIREFLGRFFNVVPDYETGNGNGGTHEDTADGPPGEPGDPQVGTAQANAPPRGSPGRVNGRIRPPL